MLSSKNMMRTRDQKAELASHATSENRSIDFKREFDPNSNLSWCEIIKDIVAMANSGGGVIIFGVNDDGSNYDAFSKDTVLKLDPAIVTDKICSYTGEDFSDFEIRQIKRKNKYLATIIVSESSIPVVFLRNGADKKDGNKTKPIFLKGTIYFRTGAKSEPAKTQHLKKFMERAIEKIRKEWFKGMRQVSEAGLNESIDVTVKKSIKTITPITGMVRLSEQGIPVKFTSEHIQELKKLFPLSYSKVMERCKNKRKAKQIELQSHINECKKITNYL